MGDIAATQWQTNLYTRTFIDDNKNGISQSGEAGIPFANVAVRLRDGSLENLLTTDFTGTANFNETFPLFSWYMVETDVTRYKNTGTHVVYDVGGPADGPPSCGTTRLPAVRNLHHRQVSGQHRRDRLGADRPARAGRLYCAGADCTGKSIQNGLAGTSDPPSVCTTTTATPPITTCSTQLSPAASIRRGWAASRAGRASRARTTSWSSARSRTAPGENGGIKGHVVYASTRPFDDPQMLVQTQWEPLVPNVTINLYQEGVAADGVTPTLTLVDTTQTSSWDDWAQGFHKAPTATPFPT